MTFLINIEFSFPIWLKQDSFFVKSNLFATWILIPGLSYKYLSFLWLWLSMFSVVYRFGGGDPGVLKAMVAGGHLGMMVVGWTLL